MQELLERLQELDRDTWESIVRGIPISPIGQYFTFDNGETCAHQYQDSYMPFHGLLPEVAFAWLQNVIQRAIEAKGWNWQLDKNSCIVLESHKTKTGEPYSELIAADHGKSPAAAILSAYLQALEANQ